MNQDFEIAKIVANSTPTSWSQAYNAGKLFAVISLESETPAEENSLNMLGKEVLDNLEAEYFAAPQKDQETIGSAVRASLEKVPEGIKTSFVVGSVVGEILYVFAKNGRVDIKRKESLGKILSAEDNIESSSGFLEDKDIILLETSQFTQLISADTLSLAIDTNPVSQIAENLAPSIHEKTEGGASAIILEYKKSVVEETLEPTILPAEEAQSEETTMPRQPEEINTPTEPKPASSDLIKGYFYSVLDKTRRFKTPSFDRSKRSILLVAAILLVVLVGSIFLALKKQSDEKNRALVAQYYTPAVKKYEEGQSLLDLNQSLARDSFMASQKLLLEGEPKFGKGSKEQKDVQDLLKKINTELENTANIKTVTPEEVKLTDSKLLSAEQSSNILFATREDSDIYTLDSSGVNKNGKQIIKKTWGQAGGLGVYFGNVYVLDKSAKQIFKFVSTSSEYVKNNYFKDSPDVSEGTGIAIDGSIWVLLSDGTVMKFTRGNSDNFSLIGLDKAFSSPTRIFTNVSTNNVYILDNGNSRIVAFDKTGAYVAQYQAPLLKDAKDIEVTKDKIFILSGGKFYSIAL